MGNKDKMIGGNDATKMPHNLILEDRRSLTVSGVKDVDSFDEQTVIVFTDMGELSVKGNALHINRLSLDVGELLVEGEIDCLSYANTKENTNGGFWGKVFR